MSAGIWEDAACYGSCSDRQSRGLGHIQGRMCLNGSKYYQEGLAGDRRYGKNSKKQQAQREEAGGEENYNAKVSNITDFLQQTLSERLALYLCYQKNVKSFSEKSEWHFYSPFSLQKVKQGEKEQHPAGSRPCSAHSESAINTQERKKP